MIEQTSDQALVFVLLGRVQSAKYTFCITRADGSAKPQYTRNLVLQKRKSSLPDYASTLRKTAEGAITILCTSCTN